MGKASSKLDDIPEKPIELERELIPEENVHVAICGFEGEDGIHYPKGTRFEVLGTNPDNDEYYNAVLVESRSKCSVKAMFLKKEDPLEKHEWYFSNIKTKRQATSVLLRYGYHGTYLVRHSETKDKCFAISLRDIDCVKHYRIVVAKETYCIEGDRKEKKFSSLEVLIDHYKHNQERLACKLRESVNKQELADSWYIENDRLEKNRRIGRGNSSSVWKGKWNGLINVAIKEYNPDHTYCAQKEIDVMKRIHHPHLVQLFGVSNFEDRQCIVLEYLPKGNLLNYLKRRSNEIDLDKIIKYSIEICDGMYHLELNGIIHRDLAARNILVGDDFTMKVGDFGLSVIDGVSNSSENEEEFATRWQPPEVLQSQRFSYKSDIWSFGILLSEMVTKGLNPYPDIIGDEIRDFIIRGNVMTKTENCDDRLYEIMKWCWEGTVERRPTFKNLIDRFQAFHGANCGDVFIGIQPPY